MQRLRHTNGLQKRLLARASIMEKREGGGLWSVCICVCVCAGKREREESKNGDIFLPSFYASSQTMPQFPQTSREKLHSVASDVHVPPFGKPARFAVWLLLGAPTLAHEDNRLAAFWIVQRWSEENPSPGSNSSQIGYYLLFRRLMR